MLTLLETVGASTALDLLAWSPPGWGATLVEGLWSTVLIALGAYGLGLFIGVLGAFGKIYGGPVLRDFLGTYTTLVRAVPELVLILILNFAVRGLINAALKWQGFGPIELSGVAIGIVILGVVQGAYSSEVLRGAILSVPAGQIEAARSMGMPSVLIARRITLPLMLSAAIPGLANLWLNATKDTALLAVVGFIELTKQTSLAAAATKAFFTFFMAAGVLYLVLALLSTVVFALLEKWARKGQRPAGGGTGQ